MAELTSEQARELRRSIRRCEQRAVWPKFPAFLIGGPLHGMKTIIDFLNYRSRSVGWNVLWADEPRVTVWYPGQAATNGSTTGSAGTQFGRPLPTRCYGLSRRIQVHPRVSKEAREAHRCDAYSSQGQPSPPRAGVPHPIRTP